MISAADRYALTIKEFKYLDRDLASNDLTIRFKCVAERGGGKPVSGPSLGLLGSPDHFGDDRPEKKMICSDFVDFAPPGKSPEKVSHPLLVNSRDLANIPDAGRTEPCGAIEHRSDDSPEPLVFGREFDAMG